MDAGNAKQETGALELLAGQLLGATESRETFEVELERVPRWRFLRRAELGRQVERRRRREQHLIDLVRDA